MLEVEVRCCCQPQKLLGWLQVASPTVHKGQWVSFLVRPVYDGQRCVLAWDATRLSLQVHEWSDYGQVGLALKAEGVELAVLRRIQGFREAAQP